MTLLKVEVKGKTIELDAGDYLIGRSPQCRICVDEPCISRQHALVVVDRTKGSLIEDLGSRNGLIVNGVRIQTCVLRTGDTVLLGKERLRVLSCNPEVPGPCDTTAHPDDGTKRRNSEETVPTHFDELAQEAALRGAALDAQAIAVLTRDPAKYCAIPGLLSRFQVKVEKVMAMLEQSGEPGPPAELIENCLRACIKVAHHKNDALWMSLAGELLSKNRELVSTSLINLLADVATSVGGLHPSHISAYLANLNRGTPYFSPGDRYRLTRLKRLLDWFESSDASGSSGPQAS